MFQSRTYSRRQFLKVTGRSAIGLTALGCGGTNVFEDPPDAETDPNQVGDDTATEIDTGAPPSTEVEHFADLFEDPRLSSDEELAALRTRWRWLEMQFDHEQFGDISNLELVPEIKEDHLYAHRYQGGETWL